MSDSRLLWVNTDAKSYRGCKRVAAPQASAINAHVQIQARAARISLSRRALGESSSAIATVGSNRWRTVTAELQSRGCESSAAEPNVRKPGDDTRDDAVTIKPDRNLRLVPRICGKDEALDPFDAAAQKIDSDMHNIIHFYLARIHPSFWGAKLHACPRQDLDYEASEIVKGCMGDKALLYSLVACTAMYMGRPEFGVCKTKTQSSAFYLQNALVAVREQVQCKAKESSGSDILQSIALMIACADFLKDNAATLAHLRAMKYLIEQRGGFAAVESGILRMIIRADIGRAVATLESPVMSSPTKPMTITLPKGMCDAELERQSEDALLLTARAEIPKQMAEHVSHLIQCIRMLDYGWTHPDASGPLTGKLLSTAFAILYYLLSASFQSQPNSDLDDAKRLEATRITLVMWTLLFIKFVWEAQQTYRNICYNSEFSITDPVVRRRLSFSGLHDLLMEWNQAIRILIQSPHAKHERVPINLIRIVQAMETKTNVKLGGLMERLFELGKQYRSRGLSGLVQPGPGQWVLSLNAAKSHVIVF